MNAKFEDITKRISEPPKWWDSNGVPRYDKFHPDLCPDIYANEIILLKITCQDCHEEFLVEMHLNSLDLFVNGVKSFAERKDIPHYGDPPWHDCIGDTMNCDDVEIVEYWIKHDFDWIKQEDTP